MTLRSNRISFDEAVKCLQAAGVENHDKVIIGELKDGTISAEGLVQHNFPNSPNKNPATISIPRTWWHHISEFPIDNVAYFIPSETNPPTPYRAERLTIPTKAIKNICQSYSSENNSNPSIVGVIPQENEIERNPIREKERGRTGPKPKKLDAVIKAMIETIRSKNLTPEKFEKIQKKILHADYRIVNVDGEHLNVGVTTCFNARNKILENWSELVNVRTPTNSDKK